MPDIMKAAPIAAKAALIPLMRTVSDQDMISRQRKKPVRVPTSANYPKEGLGIGRPLPDTAKFNFSGKAGVKYINVPTLDTLKL
jgi:hypothetical protein